MAKLIESMKAKHKVTCNIPEITVRQRVQRGNLSCDHVGVKSPVEDVEEVMIPIAIQMSRIRQPLDCMEAMHLMNSLLEGTETQARLIEFQKSRKLGNENFVPGKVGPGWWSGFLKRHGHKIVTKKGERFALNRSQWTTYPNIEQMYDVIYEEMLDAKVAIRRLEKVFTDRHGTQIVEEDSDLAYGLLQDIEIIKPEYILFADEAGFNTSQKDDGNVGGRRMLVEKGTVPQRAKRKPLHSHFYHSKRIPRFYKYIPRRQRWVGVGSDGNGQVAEDLGFDVLANR